MMGLLDQVDRMDWRVRAALSSIAAVLSLCLVFVAFNSVILGPWYVAPLAGCMSALLIILSRRTWKVKFPASLSDKIDEIVDGYKARKNKATETISGKIVWVAARCVLMIWACSQFLGLFSDMSSFVAGVITLGMGISIGIWGIEAAIWSGVVIGLLTQMILLSGLGVNLSDPATREAFLGYWNAGSVRMSWGWPIASLLVAPLWIAAAACVSVAKRTFFEAYAHRLKAAEDKKRIDERRKRYQNRSSGEGNDALEEARARYTTAHERVRRLTKGGEALDESTENMANMVAAANPGKELTGVDKLNLTEMEETLKRFVPHIKHVRHCMSTGVEVDESLRRGFDRALSASSDAFVKYINRKDAGPEAALVLAYYNELCAAEASTTSVGGGDGEIIGSIPVDEAGSGASDIKTDDGSDSSNDNTAGGGAPGPEGEGDQPNRADPSELDGLDDALEARSSTTRSSGGRFEAARSKLPNILAADALTEGPDGTPVGGVILPLKKSNSEEGKSDVSNGGEPKSERDGASATGEDTNKQPASTGEGNSEGDSSTGSESDAEKKGGATTGSTDGDSDDAVRKSSTDKSDTTSGYEPAGGEGSESSPPADQASTDSNGTDNGPATDVTAGVDGNADLCQVEVRNAAGSILSGKTDREFVLKTMGWFADAEAVAAKLNLTPDMFVERFQEYSEKVLAAQCEIDLIGVLDSDAPAMADVTSRIEKLVSMGWEHDPLVIDRARKWVSDTEEAIRLAEERRLEQLREKQAEEARLKAEAEAEEAARLQREAEEAEAAERARIEALEQEEREQRRKHLEANRTTLAFRIVLGTIDEETIVDAAEIFTTVEELSSVVDAKADPNGVRHLFDAFRKMCDARSKFLELEAAFMDEDLNAVDALLENPESFEGYNHPKIDLGSVRKWAEGQRELHKIQGFRDGTVTVGENAEGKAKAARSLMRKRLRVSVEIASVIESTLPNVMRLVASLDKTLELMGSTAPASIKESREASYRQVKGIAAYVVHNGGDGAKDYANTFLPADVRQPNCDPWSIVTELAEGVSPLDPSGLVNDEQPSDADDASAGTNKNVVSSGIKPKQWAGKRSLEEVQALDYNQELSELLTKSSHVDIGTVFRNIQVGLTGSGDLSPDMIKIEGSHALLSARDNDGEVIGQIKVELNLGAQPVWYCNRDSAVVVFDANERHFKPVPYKKVLQVMADKISPPNGDPENVIGYIRLTHNLSDDGRTSMEPLQELAGPRIRICNYTDSGQIADLLKTIHEVE